MFSTFFRKSFARPAVAPVLVNVSVFRRVLMAAWAMCLTTIVRAYEITRRVTVFAWRDRAKVIRVHALPIAASVVEDKPSRYRPLRGCIAETMRLEVLRLNNEQAVALFVQGGCPVPASISAGLVNLGPKFSLWIPRLAQALTGAKPRRTIIRREYHGANLTDRHVAILA